MALRGLLRSSYVLRRRFIPPWELEGKTAEDFFGGVLQSANPLQRHRTAVKRQQEHHADQEAAMAMYAAETHSQREAVKHAVAEEEARQHAERHFLPYGVVPQSFDAANNAAWGHYQDAVASATNTYSAETRALLVNDINAKIPYRAHKSPARGAEPQWPFHGTAGFVLDIDGVIYRSNGVIDGSDEAIRQLHALNIPFVFMTNGGGYTEVERAAQLSKILNCPIEADQVIMSHTPMQLMASRYADETVVIVGHPRCENVAKGYGFRKAISMHEFQRHHPELVPLKNWPVCVDKSDVSFPHRSGAVKEYPRVAAVFQFSDAFDTFSDVQVLVDILTSPHGQIGSAVARSQTIPFYFASDDLLWATQAPLPRLGGGAFREMLHAVYESVTGQNLHVTHYGKPRAVAYAFAERRLRDVSTRLGWNAADMRTIAMIGDNLETDVLGANARGGPWLSVHVMSGIGSAPAAKRTISEADTEMEWMSESVDRTPHYVAPTLDHFVRELLAFPESVITQNRDKAHPYVLPCPVSLQEVYNLPHV